MSKRVKSTFIENVEKANKELERCEQSSNVQARTTFIKNALGYYKTALNHATERSQQETANHQIGTCFEMLSLVGTISDKCPTDNMIESYSYFLASTFGDISQRLNSLQIIVAWLESKYENSRLDAIFFSKIYKLCAVKEIRASLMEHVVKLIEKSIIGIVLADGIIEEEFLEDQHKSEMKSLSNRLKYEREFGDGKKFLHFYKVREYDPEEAEKALEFFSDLKTKFKGKLPNSMFADLNISLIECYFKLGNLAKVESLTQETQNILTKSDPLLLKLKYFLDEISKNADVYTIRKKKISDAFKESLENGLKSILVDFLGEVPKEYADAFQNLKKYESRQLRKPVLAGLSTRILAKISHPDIIKNKARGEKFTQYCTSVSAMITEARQNL